MHEQKEYQNTKVDLRVWKRLIAYAMRRPQTAIRLMLTLLVVACVDLAYPQLTRFAIDYFIAGNTTEGIGLFAAVYAIVVILQGTGVFFFVRGAGKLEMDISYDIRQDAFSRLQQLSFSFYDTTSVGWLMARMGSDVSRLAEMIAWSLVDLCWSGFYVLGIIAVLLWMHWQLGLIVLCVAPVLAVLCVFFQRKILRQQRLVRAANSRITGAFNEGIMGAVTTKTLVREEAGCEEFRGLTGSMKQAAVRAALWSALFMPIVVALGSVSTALALSGGGKLVLGGVLGLGTLSAFLSYTTQLFDPIQQLANILAEMQAAQASAERVIDLLDTKPDIVDSPEVEAVYGTTLAPRRENWEPITGKIEFSHVDFRYKTGETVLHDFNLTVEPNQTIALVGETGSGKSTIVNLVCRFYEPTSGKVLIDGKDYRERSQLWLQSALGYVLQTPHLFSGTIAENIRFGKPDATMDEVKQAAKLACADGFIEAMEQGYDTQVGEGGGRLSTGQKQLICFARVLLADPRIFILDEATSSIDTETEQLIQTAISKVLSGRTSFVVAHRLSTIRGADQILVIDKGEIAEAGTHEELLARKGRYYQLYTHQYHSEAFDTAKQSC